jgi:hypothetical protein
MEQSRVITSLDFSPDIFEREHQSLAIERCTGEGRLLQGIFLTIRANLNRRVDLRRYSPATCRSWRRHRLRVSRHHS